MSGIDPDLIILKEGESINWHLYCGICMLILNEPM